MGRAARQRASIREVGPSGEKEGMSLGVERCVQEMTAGCIKGKGKTARGSGGLASCACGAPALAGVALLPFGDVGSVRFGFPRCQHVVSVLCLLILSVLSCRRMVGDQTRGKADGETTGSQRTWPELGGRGGVERRIRSCTDRTKRGGECFSDVGASGFGFLCCLWCVVSR